MANKITTDVGLDPELVNVARDAYKAYAANSDGKTFDGRTMPSWEALTPIVRGHWCAAVRVAGQRIGDLVRNDDTDARRIELQDLRDRLDVSEQAFRNLQADMASRVKALEDDKLKLKRDLEAAHAKTPGVGTAVDPNVGRKIVVNGRRIQVVGPLSYENVCDIAGKSRGCTVTYSAPKKGDAQRSGELHVGSPPVVLEDGMVFTAVHTGNA